MKKVTLLAIVVSLGLTGAASAAIHNYQAILSGANEPGNPNGSPGTGLGTLVLDDVLMKITVNESWTGLTAPASASHIHTAVPPSPTGGVTFGFSNVPAATSGAIPEQVFNITPAQITSLNAGLMYFNIHTSNFPGGEIGGIIVPVVPEPASLGMVGLGALLALRRRRLPR